MTSASVTKRTLILDAAVNLIGGEGLDGFTQPKVAKLSGLRQSHLTYYFPTRGDLLAAVATKVVVDRILALDAVTQARSQSAKVKSLARILTDPAQTRLLLALIQIADQTPHVRSAFDQLRQGIAPGSDALLRAWGAPSSPDTQQMLQATSTGIAVLALANGGPEFQRTAELILTRLLTDLRGTGNRERP